MANSSGATDRLKAPQRPKPRPMRSSGTGPQPPPAIANDTIVLHSKPVALDSPEGRRLVVSCTRAAENLISDSELRAEFEIFDDAEFKAISESPALIKAIRQERFSRINSGRAARESAAKIFAKAPEVLGRHLNDPSGSVKGKVEIHRELRQTAHGGDNAENPANDASKFVITFHLGADTERIEKEITPKPPQIEDKIVAEE
jgi:hypothetical protein